MHLVERGCRREDSAAAIFGCLGALPGRWGARRRRQELGRRAGGPVLAELGHRRPPQRALDHTAYGAPTFRLRIGTCPRYPISARIRLPEPGRLGQCSDAPRLAGRSEAVVYEHGGPLDAAMAAAAPHIAACCGLVRPGTARVPAHGAAQPSWRAAVSRGRAAAGVAFGHVVTQMRGEQHRRSAATGAQKADSLCSSTVFLGVSLARRLTVRNLLLRVAACLPVRGVTCATGGGSQAACVCRGSSSSTRCRSAAIISSPSFSDSIYCSRCLYACRRR